MGHVQESEDVEIVRSRNDGNYRKLVFRDGQLIGALLVGRMGDAGLLAALIDRRLQLAEFCKPETSVQLLRQSAWALLPPAIRII